MGSTELIRRRMMGSGSSIDWESIARGMVDGVTEFELTDFAVSSASNYRFYQREGLKSVVMDNTITSVGERCFGGCTNLESIVISSNLTSVGFGGFDQCTALKNITIPSSVTSIGGYAFSNCRRLVYMIFEPTTPPTLAANSVFSNTNNCPIYVPDVAVDAYKAANVWRTLADRIKPISELGGVILDYQPLSGYSAERSAA